MPQGQLERTMAGAVNYVDSRTTWLDTLVKEATRGGITQVWYWDPLPWVWTLKPLKADVKHDNF